MTRETEGTLVRRASEQLRVPHIKQCSFGEPGFVGISVRIAALYVLISKPDWFQ
jgi:hypothetical protein